MKYILTTFVTFFTIFVCLTSAQAQTNVSGNVSGRWTKLQSPYIVIANVTIQGTDSLIIEPGVVVKFVLGTSISVDGVLNAIGTETDSIRFTTYESIPNRGQWGQLAFNNANRFATNRLQYCIIEYGGSGSLYSIDMNNGTGSLEIENSFIRRNSNGIYIYGMFGKVKNTTVQENTSNGVYLNAGGTMMSCNINSNGGQGVHIASGGSLTATETVSSCLIFQNTSYGIYVSGSANIDSNIIHQNTSSGIYVICNGTIHANIDHNVIHQNTSSGIYVNYLGGTLSVNVDHNVIYDNGGSAIDGPLNAVIENNTICHNGGGVTNIRSGSSLRNNIFALNTGSGVQTSVSPAPPVKFNDFFSNGTNFSGFSVLYGDTSLGETNTNETKCDAYSNILENPLFLGSTYYLQAGSPCINAGDTLSTLDPDGSITDIGAYYYSSPTFVRTDFQMNPNYFILMNNYPNPFNPSTTIKYALPQASHVSLSVFNTLGQRVVLLVDGKQEAGYHEVNFDASSLTSGVYFYRLHAGDYMETKKLILMK